MVHRETSPLKNFRWLSGRPLGISIIAMVDLSKDKRVIKQKSRIQ